MQLLKTIIASDRLHAKWLNTLSFLENCGARKIAACEHPTFVKEEMLKHAAEEFRHAHHLKQQIHKITSDRFEDYVSILGGAATRHYLHKIDLETSRYLKQLNYKKEHAYSLVTYAIEVRAQTLYPLYHTCLKEAGSPVTVKSILLEELEHLKEMEEQIEAIARGWEIAKKICAIEDRLYQTWITAITSDLYPNDTNCNWVKSEVLKQPKSNFSTHLGIHLTFQ